MWAVLGTQHIHVHVFVWAILLLAFWSWALNSGPCKCSAGTLLLSFMLSWHWSHRLVPWVWDRFQKQLLNLSSTLTLSKEWLLEIILFSLSFLVSVLSQSLQMYMSCVSTAEMCRKDAVAQPHGLRHSLHGFRKHQGAGLASDWAVRALSRLFFVLGPS